MTAPPQPVPEFKDERQELEAVLSSRIMLRGPNISKILSYVCEKYFAGDLESIREYNIAVEALGRKPSFDPASDSIVRVEASRLRRRLREYYAAEGATHPVRIQLPETGYVPQFPRIPTVSPEAPAPEIPVGDDGARPRGAPPWSIDRFRILCLFTALIAAACCWLGWQNAQLRKKATVAPPATPYTDALWRQLLANGRHSSIVTSDANAMILGNLLNRPVTAQEYRNSYYPRTLLENRIRNPEFLQFTARLMSTYLTSTHDAIVAAEIREVAARYGAAADVLYARDFRPVPKSAENVVILGHRKANPSVELFENRMNFVYSVDARDGRALLLNKNPAAGEKQAYPLESARIYGTICYLDGGTDCGSVVLIGGNGMAGVELGGRFLCSEESVRKLYTVLGFKTRERVPPFEVLLTSQRVQNVPYEPELVAWRVAGR